MSHGEGDGGPPPARWIGLLHVRVCEDWQHGPCAADGHPLWGAEGAYVNAVAEGADRWEFERVIARYCSRLGMNAVGIDEIRPLLSEVVDDLEPPLLDMLPYLGEGVPVVFGTFHCYLDDESAAD